MNHLICTAVIAILCIALHRMGKDSEGPDDWPKPPPGHKDELPESPGQWY